MSESEVVGHGVVRCAACSEPNDVRAEWCDRCLAEFAPAQRRRPRRLATRALTRPVPATEKAFT